MESKKALNWVSIVDESEKEESLDEAKDSKLEEVDRKDEIDNLCSFLKDGKRCANLKKKGDQLFCGIHRHHHDRRLRVERLVSRQPSPVVKEVKIKDEPKQKEEIKMCVAPHESKKDKLEELVAEKVKSKLELLDEKTKELIKFLLL